MTHALPLALIDAIAERVYVRQEGAINRRCRSGAKPKPWAELTPAEKFPWRDGARIYVGVAVKVGWRPPAKARRR